MALLLLPQGVLQERPRLLLGSTSQALSCPCSHRGSRSDKSLIFILVAVMNLHPPEAMAVRSTGWCFDGVGPYLEPLLEWTIKFRFGLGGRKTISKETNPALFGDADGRPGLRDTKFEVIHVTLLGADRAWIEGGSFGSGSTVPIRGG